MKTKKRWFTLIEILVWVSISIILMMGVWVFVTSWIQNILSQKIMVSDLTQATTLYRDVQNIFSNGWEILSYSGGGLLARTQWFQFGKPLVYDVSLKSMTWVCENDPSLGYDMLELKNYNPFVVQNGIYSGSYTNHTISKDGNIFLGKGILWEKFLPGMKAENLFLNTPAWLETVWGALIFSESGNDRVLYTSGSNVFSLLNRDMGLYQPTDIWYDNGENALYILNSWKNELWKMFSTGGEVMPLDIDAHVTSPQTFSSLRLTFSQNFSLTWTYGTGNIHFGNPITGSTWDTISLSGWSIEYTFWNVQNLSIWDHIAMQLSPLFWIFLQYWRVFVELSLSGGVPYTKLFPYVTHSDLSLFTVLDNSLEVYKIPTDGFYSMIEPSGNSLILKDFLHHQEIPFNITNKTFGWTGVIMAPFPDFETISTKYDLKVKDFHISVEDWFLTMMIEYYTYFDCYNTGKNLTKTLLIKKTTD